MATRKPKIYAICYGAVICFTEKQWLQMLRAVALDKEVNYFDYGTQLSEDSHNITDLNQEQAIERLAEYHQANVDARRYK